MDTKPILARATIHLPGLKPDNTYYVDASSEYVQICIKAGYLVPEEEELEEAAGEDPQDAQVEEQPVEPVPVDDGELSNASDPHAAAAE